MCGAVHYHPNCKSLGDGRSRKAALTMAVPRILSVPGTAVLPLPTPIAPRHSIGAPTAPNHSGAGQPFQSHSTSTCMRMQCRIVGCPHGAKLQCSAYAYATGTSISDISIVPAGALGSRVQLARRGATAPAPRWRNGRRGPPHSAPTRRPANRPGGW